MTVSPTPHYSPGDTFENTVIKEIGLIRQNLNPDDVFALDAGLTIYQINGPNCDKDEKVGDIRAFIFRAKITIPVALVWHCLRCGKMLKYCNGSIGKMISDRDFFEVNKAT